MEGCVGTIQNRAGYQEVLNNINLETHKIKETGNEFLKKTSRELRPVLVETPVLGKHNCYQAELIKSLAKYMNRLQKEVNIPLKEIKIAYNKWVPETDYDKEILKDCTVYGPITDNKLEEFVVMIILYNHD